LSLLAEGAGICKLTKIRRPLTKAEIAKLFPASTGVPAACDWIKSPIVKLLASNRDCAMRCNYRFTPRVAVGQAAGLAGIQPDVECRF
jgi:hypothetical protein